jgi:hypothetical protein
MAVRRAGWTRGVVFRAEHEAVDEELRVPSEGVSQGGARLSVSNRYSLSIRTSAQSLPPCDALADIMKVCSAAALSPLVAAADQSLPRRMPNVLCGHHILHAT